MILEYLHCTKMHTGHLLAAIPMGVGRGDMQGEVPDLGDDELRLGPHHPRLLHGALPRHLPPALPVRHGRLLQGCQGLVKCNNFKYSDQEHFFQIIALVWGVSFLSALPYAFFTKLNYIHRPLSSNRTEDILDDSAFCALLDENIYPQARKADNIAFTKPS